MHFPRPVGLSTSSAQTYSEKAYSNQQQNRLFTQKLTEQSGQLHQERQLIPYACVADLVNKLETKALNGVDKPEGSGRFSRSAKRNKQQAQCMDNTCLRSWGPASKSSVLKIAY